MTKKEVFARLDELAPRLDTFDFWVLWGKPDGFAEFGYDKQHKNFFIRLRGSYDHWTLIEFPEHYRINFINYVDKRTISMNDLIFST